MMKMYPDKFSKWIFPHSPWASDLKIDLSKEELSNLDEKYKNKFKKFNETKDVDAEIVYLDWENSFKPISWLWRKLQSKNITKQYKVTWWNLHFMPQLIKFMKNLRVWSIINVSEYKK